MLPALCSLVPLVVTLAGAPGETPSSQVISPELRARQVVIPEVTSAPAPRLHLAPGFITTLRFDASLDPATVVTDAPPEFLALMEVGESTVTLEPRTALPEHGLTLTVGFADGHPPARASFTLAPAGGEVDVQVRVMRPPRQTEPLQAPPEDPRARYEAGLFARLVLSGRLRDKGVALSRAEGTLSENKLGDVDARDRRIYHSETLAVVAVKLKLSAASPQPWVPGEAWLLDASGRMVGKSPVWMDGARLDPGQELNAAVEVELVPGAPRRRLRLELREKEGGRTVRIDNLKL